MKPNKVVLAYSGGLDTSVIAKWLMEKYGCEVITFTADIGQGSETKDASTTLLGFILRIFGLRIAGCRFDPSKPLVG